MKKKDYLNKIIHGDCLEVMKEIPDESIDLIITDPPYEKKYFYLWKSLPMQAERILKEHGSFVSLLGHYQIPDVIEEFKQTNLRYWWIGWMPQRKIHTLLGKYVSVKGKPFIWYLEGKRKKIDGYHIPWDSFDPKDETWKESQKLHKWGQSVAWFAHYIKNMTIKNDTVLDPFLGSGSVAIACKQENRNFIGIELDEKYVKIARERITGA